MTNTGAHRSAYLRTFESPPGEWQYAVDRVTRVCCVAGDVDFLDRQNAALDRDGIAAAVSSHDTATIYSWLMTAFSLQGISDSAAFNYIETNGQAKFSSLANELTSRSHACPKTQDYWNFSACGYSKSRQRCARADHFDACAVPRLPLRNGRLNQMAVSLFLFVRDVCDGDLIEWIDQRLSAVDGGPEIDRVAAVRRALLSPLSAVYGLSNKTISMALASLLMAAPEKTRWRDAAQSMIAIDSLVHNFLVRSGILRRLNASHPYGESCYQSDGCSGILRSISSLIDARQFNRQFPANFPRFIQHAIWRFCAAGEFNICNGNQINDNARCKNRFCSLSNRCDRNALRPRHS